MTVNFPRNALRLGDRAAYYSGAKRCWIVRFYNDDEPTPILCYATSLNEALEMENPCTPNSSSPQ